MAPHRLLARTLINNGQVKHLQLLTPTPDGGFSIAHFAMETERTVFEDRPVAIIPAEAPLPTNCTVNEAIQQLLSSDYHHSGHNLKLITITPSGCHTYKQPGT